MGLYNLLVILVIGGVAGWLAGLLMKGRGFGLLGDIVIGVIGASVGNWLLGALGVSLGAGLIGAVIRATIGAVLVIFVVRVLKKA